MGAYARHGCSRLAGAKSIAPTETATGSMWVRRKATARGPKDDGCPLVHDGDNPSEIRVAILDEGFLQWRYECVPAGE